MRRVLAILASSLVIGLGLITLWGLFPGSPVAPIASNLVGLVVLVFAGVALLMGSLLQGMFDSGMLQVALGVTAVVVGVNFLLRHTHLRGAN